MGAAWCDDQPSIGVQVSQPGDSRHAFAHLLAVQEEVALAEHEAFVGRAVEVLVEGPSKLARTRDGGQLVGRTRSDHIVVFDGDASLAGTLADVHIESASALTLFGRLTGPGPQTAG